MNTTTGLPVYYPTRDHIVEGALAVFPTVGIVVTEVRFGEQSAVPLFQSCVLLDEAQAARLTPEQCRNTVGHTSTNEETAYTTALSSRTGCRILPSTLMRLGVAQRITVGMASRSTANTGG